jgi:hypothetical protein
MKSIVIVSLLWSIVCSVQALTLSEIFSNPTGTDDGREWVEVYNETTDPIDLSSLTISIKGATPLAVTLVQGGSVIAPHSYAIIASSVSSQTKFLQDYPSYTLPLFRSTIGLVNTGVTSIDIRLQGVVADSLSSYTAAKEGSSLSKVNGSWVTTSPTPGAENITSEENSSQNSSQQTTSQTTTQSTLSQMSPPSQDIVLYVPFERVLVAGADALFNASAQTKSGKNIEGMNYMWAFGDGGRATGSSTYYRYAYPGHYIAQVEGTNGSVIGVATTKIHVVEPQLTITEFSEGKYGSYVDILNPNPYDLELSQWKMSIDGAFFTFPPNTRIGGNRTTRFSGAAMGFASTTKGSVKVIKVLFPNNELVTTFSPRHEEGIATTSVVKKNTTVPHLSLREQVMKKQAPQATTTTLKNSTQKDTKIASFLKNIFSH